MMSREPDSHATPRPMPMPTEIDGYRILRVLGQGGMATVYAAQQAHPRRTVAIKVMRPSLATPAMLRRFSKEIDVLAKLSHPCIAQIYSAGVMRDGASELPYFVMEYIAGAHTILQFAEEKGLDRSTRLKLFAQVCAAIDHGHRQRVLHLDLKPGNVLIDREGHLKVIDFGVAKALAQPGAEVTAVTAESSVLGSLHAMSPEQIDPAGRDLDARSDVYSLGVLLYRLLLGVLPYDLAGKSIVAAARTICETPARPPRHCDASISPALEAVMLRALEKDRDMRFRTAGEFGKAVLRAAAGEMPKETRTPRGKDADHAAKQARSSSGASGKVIAIVTGVVLVAAVVWTSIMLKREIDAHSAPPAAEDDGKRGLSLGAGGAPVVKTDADKPFALAGHSAFVSQLVLSPDGRSLASASNDGAVRLWDLEKRTTVRTFNDFAGVVISAAAAANGGTIAAFGTQDGIVRMESAERGVLSLERNTAPGPVHFVIFSPTGELASASEDLTAKLWSDKLALRATLRSASGPFVCGCFSADGAKLAAATVGGHVDVLDASTGREIAHHHLGREPAQALAFSADGETLTALTAAGVALQIDVASGERVTRFAAVGETPTALALDDVGEHVFVARPDRTIECWAIASGEQFGEPLPSSFVVTRMTFSGSMSRLLVASADGMIEAIHVSLAGAE